VATDVVDVRADANVAAQVISKRFLPRGRIAVRRPRRASTSEAALRVARFQQQKRDGLRA
jgi:hypothetical protein